jgi:TonB family protein
VISGQVTLDNHDIEGGIDLYINAGRTTIRTTTDNDGNYRIDVDSSLTKLIFSTSRYREKRISIEKDSIINVTLEESAIELDEFTIKAYIKPSKTIFVYTQDTIKVNKFRIRKKNRYIIHKSEYAERKEEAQILRVEKEMDFRNFIGREISKHIYDNINYPNACALAGIQGKVYVHFIIDLEGNVKDAKISRGVQKLIDQEVLSAIQSAPQFAKKEIDIYSFLKNKHYFVRCCLPITFRIFYE